MNAIDKLKKVSTATLTTVLFKRGFRNVFIQGVFLLNKEAPRIGGQIARILRQRRVRHGSSDHTGEEGEGGQLGRSGAYTQKRNMSLLH